jgi:hypothetical protein
MSKKTQKNVVDTMTHDELSMLSDSEISARQERFENELQRRGIPAFSTAAQPYEIELAYIQRELEMRMTRRNLHRAYLSSLDESFVDESHLPEFKAVPPPWYWQPS